MPLWGNVDIANEMLPDQAQHYMLTVLSGHLSLIQVLVYLVYQLMKQLLQLMVPPLQQVGF